MQIRIDTTGIDDLTRHFDLAPAAITRARRAALRKTAVFAQKTVGQSIRDAVGLPISAFKKLNRFAIRFMGNDGMRVWTGTNPVPAHNFGTVKWNRRMVGARAGKKSFAGSFAWNRPQGTLIMQRTGAFGRRGNPRLERIAVVRVPIHDAVTVAMRSAQPAVVERYQTLLMQQLNYELFKQSQRTGG